MGKVLFPTITSIFVLLCPAFSFADISDEYCGYTEDLHHQDSVVCLNQYACHCDFPSGNTQQYGANQSDPSGCDRQARRCEDNGGTMNPELIETESEACISSKLNADIIHSHIECQEVSEGECYPIQTYSDCIQVDPELGSSPDKIDM